MIAKKMRSEYYQIQTGYGPLHVHIDYDATGPKQVFCSLPPVGTELSSLAALLGVTVSLFLKEGGDATRLPKHLQSARGDKSVGFGKQRVNSIGHALSIALAAHLEKHPITPHKQTELDTTPIIVPEGEAAESAQHVTPVAGLAAHESDVCPQCYSPGMIMQEGCMKCGNCNFSKCS